MFDNTLAAATLLSPNRRARTHGIDTLTIHHAACVGASAADVGRLFLDPARKASCNYAIGNDGDVALVVPEAYAALTSSNRANDDRAVTIEVANCGGAPDWPVSDAAMASLVALCADVCRRNGIDALRWRGDPALVGQPDKQNMTVHRWFAATACPGDCLYNKMGEIAERVNALLAADEPGADPDTTAPEPAPRVRSLDDAPLWARPTLEKLVSRGILEGKGGDKGLDLGEDMTRLLVILDRAGTFENGK